MPSQPWPVSSAQRGSSMARAACRAGRASERHPNSHRARNDSGSCSTAVSAVAHRLVETLDGGERKRDNRPRVAGQRIVLARSPRLCQPLIEATDGPLKEEEPVPAARLHVLRVERERLAELAIRPLRSSAPRAAPRSPARCAPRQTPGARVVARVAASSALGMMLDRLAIAAVAQSIVYASATPAHACA